MNKSILLIALILVLLGGLGLMFFYINRSEKTVSDAVAERRVNGMTAAEYKALGYSDADIKILFS